MAEVWTPPGVEPVWNRPIGRNVKFLYRALSGVLKPSATPPPNPQTGDLWAYNGISGQVWMFTFDASQPTYKWMFVGGPPYTTHNESVDTLGASGWQTAALMTVPLTGNFNLSFSASLGASPAANTAITWATTIGDGTTAYGYPWELLNYFQSGATLSTPWIFTSGCLGGAKVMTAGTVLKLNQGLAGWQCTSYERTVNITPIAVLP